MTDRILWMWVQCKLCRKYSPCLCCWGLLRRESLTSRLCYRNCVFLNDLDMKLWNGFLGMWCIFILLCDVIDVNWMYWIVKCVGTMLFGRQYKNFTIHWVSYYRGWLWYHFFHKDTWNPDVVYTMQLIFTIQ